MSFKIFLKIKPAIVIKLMYQGHFDVFREPLCTILYTLLPADKNNFKYINISVHKTIIFVSN